MDLSQELTKSCSLLSINYLLQGKKNLFYQDIRLMDE